MHSRLNKETRIYVVGSIKAFGVYQSLSRKYANVYHFKDEIQNDLLDLGTWIATFPNQLGFSLRELKIICFKVGQVTAKGIALFVGLSSREYIDKINGKAYNWRLSNLESKSMMSL